MTLIPPDSRSAAADRLVSIFIVTTVALDVALVVCVVFLGLANRTMGDREDASSIRACQEANIDRARSIEIFNQILALPAIGSPQFITRADDKKQELAVSEIKARVRMANTPHNCVAEYQK